MKSAIATVGVFAALANAASYPRMLRIRGDNSTITDAGSTTLTVIQTNVETITSCAETVVNCPANPTDIAQLPESEQAIVTVTNTVVLKTTVCPVSEAPAVSSSVIADADKGIITGSTMTLSTTYISPDEPVETGSGNSPEGGDSGKGNGDNNGKPEEESTTTTTATSTSYQTVTVEPAVTGSGNSPEGGDSGKGNDDNNGKGNGGNGGEDCVATTVTVTAAASTVYVTVGADATKDTSNSPTGVADEGDDEEDSDEEAGDDECVPGNGDEEDDEDADDEEDSDEDAETGDEEDECPISSTSVVEETVTVVPIPVTPTGPIITSAITPTPGVANPTGFYRMMR